jgi:hypothetical protein
MNYHIAHLRVSVRISLAFLNSHSSADAIPVSTATSVTNQSLSELKLHKIHDIHEWMSARRVKFTVRNTRCGDLEL